MQFFESQREKLEEAARGTEGYGRLSSSCANAQRLIDQKYPELPQMNTVSTLQSLPVDRYSKTLLPPEWKHVTPLQCIGDGNCLYRYLYHSGWHLKGTTQWTNPMYVHVP